MTSLSLSTRLHDRWFEPAPPTRLAMVRILLGGFVLAYLFLGRDTFTRVAETDRHLFAPVGVVFHGPIGVEAFQWLFGATAVAGLCFTLGLAFRITGPLFAGLLLWLFCYRQSWGMIFHSFNLIVLHVGILGLTRSGDALSLDALLRARSAAGRAARPAWQYGWPLMLTNAVTVSAYFLSAVAKLAGPLGIGWISGHALRSQVAVDGIRKELLGADPNAVSYTLYEWLPLFTLLAAGSMVLELGAPLALSRRIGRIWAVNTLAMHWGIFFVMGITFEHHLTGIVFAPFFHVERILDWLPRLTLLRGASAARAPGTAGATPSADSAPARPTLEPARSARTPA